jgi:DNA-binding GntR family transcriptional regulator
MITRERLSTDVHQEVLNRIIRGEIAPGKRLKDAELAEDLGVSRTPIREALLRLEREGFLSSQKHLGFSVKRLQESEIHEVYPLVRLLECSALDSAPLPCVDKIKKLTDLGFSLKLEGSDPLRRIELDSSWHEALIEDNGNRHLMRVLFDLKRLLLRYEYAFMRDDALVSESVEEHNAILSSMERGDRREAVRLLGAHWDRCTKATLGASRASGLVDPIPCGPKEAFSAFFANGGGA